MSLKDNQKIVYLVRHGESEGNAARIFQGDVPPLTPVGEAQAVEIARRASALTFDTLMVSDFLRARQTADAIKELTGKEYEIHADLGEMREPSSIVGKSFHDPVALSTWRKWVEQYSNGGEVVEDGETFDEMLARVDRTLKLFLEHESHSILAVTHGFFLRAIIARILLGEYITPQNFMHYINHSTTTNTGLYLITYGELLQGVGWKLRIYNDHAHLG